MRSVAIAVICGLTGLGLSHFLLPKKFEMRYNCELAEISPDFPVEVKQCCRELKAKQ